MLIKVPEKGAVVYHITEALGARRMEPTSTGSSSRELPATDSDPMLSLVLVRHASSPDLVGVDGSAEGSLELDDERRAAGGAGLDLVPTSGAHGTCWSRSGSAPDASAHMSSSMQAQTATVRRYS